MRLAVGDTGALLTLDRIRFELRVPPGAPSANDDLVSLADSATSIASRDTQIPIIDTEVQIALSLDGFNNLFVVDRYRIDNGTAVKYRSQGDSEGVYSETMPQGDYTPTATVNGLQIKAGASGWPVTPDGVFAVSYMRGLSASDPDFQSVQSLVILKIRQLWDGVPAHRPNVISAYDRLAGSLARLDTPEFDLIGVSNE